MDEMPLDETIAFVEARETGKTSLKILSGGLSSVHLNKVHENVSTQEKCKYFRKRGHGKQPRIDLRKDSCPAFGKNCNNCGILGHCNDQCKKNPKDKASEEHNKSAAKENSVEL